MKFRQLSIALFLIAGLVTVVTVFLSTFAAVVFHNERDQRWVQLHNTLTANVDQQAAGLALPVWNMDETNILAILQSGMIDREVYAIVVSTSEKPYGTVRDANWHASSLKGPVTDQGLLVEERVIYHGKEPLGAVKVYVSGRFLQEDLEQRRSTIIAFIVALDITLVVALTVMLWFAMIQPIKRLQAYAGSIGMGRQVAREPGNFWFFGELYALKRSIHDMTVMLEHRFEALQSSENRLKLATRAASIGVWDWDIDQDKLVWDDEMHSLFDVAKEHFSGKLEDWRKTLTPEDAERMTLELQAVIRGEHDLATEFRIVRADGETRVIKAESISVRDHVGRVVRLVGINLDITESRMAKERVQRLNAELEDRVKERTAQLEQANTDLAKARDQAEQATRAKSEFLANMSHEIRTPMNAILGLTRLTLRTDLSKKQKDYLQNVMVSAGSLLGIIDDILDFSKIEAGKLEMESRPFALQEVLDKVSTVTALKAHEKGLDFLIDLEPSLPTTLIGDPLRLGQVLINLCNNAVKFTSHGEVAVLIRQAGPVDQGRLTLRFSVLDTGIGMTEEQQAKLFTPFTQVDASTTRLYGGTGLGLAISKQIVALMQGEIAVSSLHRAGTRFDFTAAFGVAEAKADPLVSEDALRQLRVLVIDDSQRSRDICKALLSSLGCIPTVAESGVAGLTRLKQAAPGEAYDVVLLDANLPEIDSYELVSLIRNRPAPVPEVILIASFLDEDVTRRMATLGVRCGLVRPIGLRALHDVLLEARHMPALAPDRQDEYRSAASSAPALLRGRSVLLVEDNTINQIVATDLLRDEAGMQVTIAEDGVQALHLLFSQSFDLVLMDIQMPGMDGLEATRRIRQDPRHTKLPVIAMTAHALTSDRAACLAAGMNDCVVKPFEPQVLFNVLARWLHEDQGMAESGLPGMGSGEPAPPERGINFDVGMRRCMGKAELYQRIATRFLGSRREDVRHIREALAGGNPHVAVDIAHQLISSAGTIGAESLSHTARTLQTAITQDDLSALLDLVASLDEQLQEVLSELQAYLADVSDAGQSA
ncbi:MAG: response regulator [Aquabacterium sp.]|uniref:hybrid sensor histidine kinase/response regulator n=1 Tax=Aquabacterium sp. TaxID=1872578 RepID=UPI0025B8EFC3|nr:response regulator [Aquabacterium sp.]MBI3382220.1 response regulator [Aquabacterium sp.]